jgi:glucan phosphoethanolaminetransferase (alkaline phosphatase superfamily)
MEDRFSKYFHLTFNLFFTFLAFIVSLLLLMFGLRYAFGLLDYIPWFVYLFVILIILVPATLFITIFTIYIKRTKTHPSAAVRYISQGFFAVALLCWAAAFVMDMITFFKTGSRAIDSYYSYNIFLLAASVAGIFIIGVIQALTYEKEKDWMEKRSERGLED